MGAFKSAPSMFSLTLSSPIPISGFRRLRGKACGGESIERAGEVKKIEITRDAMGILEWGYGVRAMFIAKKNIKWEKDQEKMDISNRNIKWGHLKNKIVRYGNLTTKRPPSDRQPPGPKDLRVD